ncbi:MAG TPA: DUF997 domain-containing protein [Phycisphaerae bacterium]|nr:DUF997 domain-containing protein [Phycisphaerae bacterium]
MIRKRSVWARRAFVLAFALLTSLCWCPWAYGTLTGRVLAIPAWAVVAYAFAVALFVLEWVFLFFTGLAVDDEELPTILSDLAEAASKHDAASKEGR